VVLISFPGSGDGADGHNELQSKSKLFIQMVYFSYEGVGEEGINPMQLSREFAEKFSEIFLKDTMADFFK
jgi:hypothetical protein